MYKHFKKGGPFMISKYGYYKVATGSFIISLGNIKENKKEIIKLISEAKENEISLLTLSELSLTGYSLGDLFLHHELSDKCFEAITDIIKVIPSNMIVTVGAPFYYNNKLFDVAYVLTNNSILGIVPKTYLASYNEFYEARWFSSSKEVNFKEVNIDGLNINFGTDLIFNLNDLKIGIEICEDLWVINPRSNDLVLGGANVIANLSASSEIIGKKEFREDMIRLQSKKLSCSYLYCTSGSGESSTDLIFSRQNLIYSCGHLVNKTNDENGLTIGIIDLNLIDNNRIKFKSSFTDSPLNSYRYCNIKSDFNKCLLPLDYEPYPFILKDENKRIARCLEILNLQKLGLMQRLKKIKCKNVVLGISGGLDSTLALLVAVEAFKELGFNLKGIHALRLKGFATSTITENNSKQLIELAQVNKVDIDITLATTQHLKDLNHPLDLYDVTFENSQARERTQILMDYANKVNGIVIGTGDLSELALGWCTFNGDHMSMYGVNSSIPKTLIKYIISSYGRINDNFSNVLKNIIDTPISPELIPSKDKDKIGQKTEDILGKYDLHDFYLYNFIRNGFSKEKIFQLAKIAFKEQINEEEIEKSLNLFFTRFFLQQFKRSTLPDGAKIGSVSLSPRGDFKMPSDIDSLNSFTEE